MARGNDNKAKVYGYLGSTGCGKTTAMFKRLAKPTRKRVLVWSPKEPIDNYAGRWPGTLLTGNLSEVVQAVARAGDSGGVRVVFKPAMERKLRERQFDVFSQLYKAGDLTIIAEELHTVTRASWAPDGWSEMILMGRGYGTEVFGCSQRPANMDKDFFGNCSIVRVGRLNYPEDRAVMAKALGVPLQDVAGLNGFQFIEKDSDTGKISRG